MMQLPPEMNEVISKLDKQTDGTSVSEVFDALAKCIDKENVETEHLDGWLAERVAFALRGTRPDEGSPWGTYFAPMMTWYDEHDNLICSPSLDLINEDVLMYWAERSGVTRNPSMTGRYSDLVWDFSRRITRKSADITHARRAINSYLISVLNPVGGNELDVHVDMPRMLSLAISISDKDLIEKSTDAVIGYCISSGYTSIGNSTLLFDLLISGKGVSNLPKEKTEVVLNHLDSHFDHITAPDGDSFSTIGAEQLGSRIIQDSKQKRNHKRIKEVQIQLAKMNERRAGIGDSMSALHFLEVAKSFYQDAEDVESVARLNTEIEEASKKARAEMPVRTVEYKIENRQIEDFKSNLISGGISQGLSMWAATFVPTLSDIEAHLQEINKQYPIQSIFGKSILGEAGVEAKISSSHNKVKREHVIHEISNRLQLDVNWMLWGMESLVDNGLNIDHFADHFEQAALYDSDTIVLALHAFEKYFEDDFISSMHVALPAIERSLRNAVKLGGGSVIKPRRREKGANQLMNMGEALHDKHALEVLTPDLCTFIYSRLASNKGSNLRNTVLHGRMKTSGFSREYTIIVLHCLLATSLIRFKDQKTVADTEQ